MDLNQLLEYADEINYDGTTQVGNYNHKYSVVGRMVSSQVNGRESNDVIDLEPVNEYRTILRTSIPIEKILGSSEDNPFK